ncbi:MAG: flippase [Actinomycetia bacterium]|nr:flippase [Actinomycetes bacterium]
MGDKRRIVGNTLAMSVAQLFTMATSLVLMPFIVRDFGLSHYGLYMLAISASSYATLLDFGVGSSVVKFVSERRARGEDDRISLTVSSALAFYMVVGLVAALGLVVLALNTQLIFRLTGDEARLVRNLFFVAAAAALLTWPLSTGYHILGGIQRYNVIARNLLLGSIFSAAATISVLVLHEGPVTLLAATSMVTVCVGILNFTRARKELGAAQLSLGRARRSAMREILTFSWAIFISQVTLVILYQQTDRIVLGVFAGAAAIGLYEAAGKFQGLISQLTSLANTSVMPATSQLQAEQRTSALESLFMRGTKYVCIVINPIVVLLIVLARPIIIGWLGAEFAPAVTSAQILVSYQLLSAGTSVGDSMVVGLGKLPKRLPYVISIAVANLALSIVLVQRYGIIGVVIGTALPWYLEFPSHIWFHVRVIGVSARRWFRDIVLRTYPILLVPAALAWGAMKAGLTSSLIATGFVALGSLVCYWALAYLVSLTEGERAEVKALSAAVLTTRRRQA